MRSGLDTYTKLLAHFDGADGEAGDYTAETGQTITTVGTAQLDTAQFKFGTASLLLDGNSDYATAVDSDDWSFGTGDFTIDLWLRPMTIDTDQFLISQYVDTNNRWSFAVDAANKLGISSQVSSTTQASYTSTSAIPGYAINTWFHLAVARSSANVYMFVNGTSVAVTTGTAFTGSEFSNLATVLAIGGYLSTPIVYTGGHFEEVRISKGIARWVGSFTPPSREYGVPGGYSPIWL